MGKINNNRIKKLGLGNLNISNSNAPLCLSCRAPIEAFGIYTKEVEIHGEKANQVVYFCPTCKTGLQFELMQAPKVIIDG